MCDWLPLRENVAQIFGAQNISENKIFGAQNISDNKIFGAQNISENKIFWCPEHFW